MRVCVVGMWHLGSVTAACLASMGHRVIGYDEDSATISALAQGRPPLFEPGLAELTQQQLTRDALSFSADARTALSDAEVVWVAIDTPVDDDDVADVDGTIARIEALFPHLGEGAVVIVSSQLIAGCTRELQQRFGRAYPNRHVDFVYSPENLRLGKALSVFLEPDRVVVGANSEHARTVVSTLLAPFADKILWMSVESAEMTKHALNAFLATCVTFANEIAAICEQVGADAKEVERGLKSEKRIGPSAYIAPGAAFAGGTLARDVQYLKGLARDYQQPAELLSSIKQSNDRHRSWAQRKLSQRLGGVRGKTVAVFGLTYKPGTDTLRRSTSIELCRWLAEEGARIVAHDPVVTTLPAELASFIRLERDIPTALRDVDALVIATPWPEYKELSVSGGQAPLVVLDANRVGEKSLAAAPGVEYIAVGTPGRPGELRGGNRNG